MIWLVVVIGLVMLAVCMFVCVAAIKADKWYNHYSNPARNRMKKKAAARYGKRGPSDAWYILTALSAFVGISILTFVPFLMPILAFLMLFYMTRIRQRGEQCLVARITIWSVIIGAGLLGLSATALLYVGFSKSLPARMKTDTMHLNEFQKGLPSIKLAQLLDKVKGSNQVLTNGAISVK